MHPAQITAALKMAGYNQKALAEEIGVAPTSVGAVIHGRSRSSPIEGRIAAITGHALAELWPQWHGEKPLVLSNDERSLVLLYRELDPSQRAQIIPVFRTMRSDVPNFSARNVSVTASGNSRVAGRDMIEGGKRRK